MTHFWDTERGFKLHRTHLIESLGANVQMSCNEQHVVQQNNFLPGLLFMSRDRTLACGWDSMLMDVSLLFPCSGVSLLQVLFVMERDAGSSLEAYLVSDPGV